MNALKEGNKQEALSAALEVHARARVPLTRSKREIREEIEEKASRQDDSNSYASRLIYIMQVIGLNISDGSMPIRAVYLNLV
jgi:hypothetical protein